jgi:hypothetical protein
MLCRRPEKELGAGSHFIMILEPADIRQKEVVAASLPRHVAA